MSARPGLVAVCWGAQPEMAVPLGICLRLAPTRGCFGHGVWSSWSRRPSIFQRDDLSAPGEELDAAEFLPISLACQRAAAIAAAALLVSSGVAAALRFRARSSSSHLVWISP